jgi:hypothetical protein
MSRLDIFLVMVAVGLGLMVFRLVRPVPDGDRTAIKRFLKDREQTLVGLRKLWFAGSLSASRYEVQPGRAYQVLARSGDGAVWRHYLGAGVGTDDVGQTKRMERSEGVWARVLQ